MESLPRLDGTAKSAAAWLTAVALSTTTFLKS